MAMKLEPMNTFMESKKLSTTCSDFLQGLTDFRHRPTNSLNGNEQLLNKLNTQREIFAPINFKSLMIAF